MKNTSIKGKILLLALLAIGTSSCTEQEVLSTLGTVMQSNTGQEAPALSNQEVIAGLRDALRVGTEQAVSLGSALDGFNANPKIHIPFPEEAIKVKNTVEDLGLGSEVDRFVTTLNRAAEEASKDAGDIFLNAILDMSIQDGFAILKGEENAATNYLRDKTYDQLFQKFSPKVEDAVAKVKVGEKWTPLANAYNTATLLTGGQKVDPDLNSYVTTKAIDGLFVLLSEEEQKIRKDPVARVTDILKRVFGSLDQG